MADKQFAGRGQTTNSWYSEEGSNLTFSMLLNPVFLSVDRQFGLNKAVSLALNDVLRKHAGPDALIKWPNDCYIGDKKTGGILIENIVQGSRIRHAIIGIGLNVNQTVFPSSIKNVTSLKKALHRDYDLDTLLTEICGAVEARYLQLKAGHVARLAADYLDNLYLLNEWSLYRFNDQVHGGKITGVNEYGQLKLETAEGEFQFSNKEIEFINR